MRKVNVHEAKTHLSRLLDEVAEGEEIVIARAGRPVALLSAWRTKARSRRLGLFPGEARLADDFDVLPPDLAGAFEGDGT